MNISSYKSLIKAIIFFISCILFISSILSCHNPNINVNRNFNLNPLFTSNIQYYINLEISLLRKYLVKVYIKNDNNNYYNGFIINNNGYIITTIPDISNYDLLYINHQSNLYSAELIKKFKEHDIVLIKAKSNDLTIEKCLSFTQNLNNYQHVIFINNIDNNSYSYGIGVINYVNLNNHEDLYFTIDKKYKTNCNGCPVISLNGDIVGMMIDSKFSNQNTDLYININNYYKKVNNIINNIN